MSWPRSHDKNIGPNAKSIAYGEILSTLFMRFKSRDPVICIFITWSRDYDSNAIDRFYAENQKYELFLAIRISRNRSGS